MIIALENPLNASPLVFPVLECFHILGFAVLVGTIAVVDFRLLGFGLRHQAVANVAQVLAPWTMFALGVVLLSGPLLFASDPDMYYLNRSFQIKMACLALAILFHYTTHRKTALKGASPGWSKLVACVSIALWLSVIWGGIFIAFVNTRD